MAKASPKLSVVVVSYNKADRIDMLRRSIEAQTRQPDEVVAVDDGSLDGTNKILLQKYHNWKIVILPRNQGQSYARNAGARYVFGEYLIFVDGDLELEPTMLEVLERTLDENPDVSIAYGHYNRKGSRTDHVRASAWNPKLLRQVNYVSMMSMIRRKDMPMPPFDVRLRRYEDWDLWLTMMEADKKGLLVDAVLFTAHYKTGDISASGESEQWYNIVRDKHGLEPPSK